MAEESGRQLSDNYYNWLRSFDAREEGENIIRHLEEAFENVYGSRVASYIANNLRERLLGAEAALAILLRIWNDFFETHEYLDILRLAGIDLEYQLRRDDIDGDRLINRVWDDTRNELDNLDSVLIEIELIYGRVGRSAFAQLYDVVRPTYINGRTVVKNIILGNYGTYAQWFQHACRIRDARRQSSSTSDTRGLPDIVADQF
jgi:hypothetical protein